MNAELQELLPIVIPLVVIFLILAGAALWDLRKQPATRGPKWIWALVIFCFSCIGPVVYFAVGRKEE
jgi:hypothetical protein